MVFIGKVERNNDDSDDGERIRVRLVNTDARTSNIEYAWPLLPKIMHIKPKEGEAVLIFCINDNPNEQRFYLGPITSQYQHLYRDYFDYGATKLIGGNGTPDTAISNIPKTHGAFATNDDVAIYGRKNSDIIIGDSDIRIRCGVKLVGTKDTTDISFNKANPSFIKLRYHETPMDMTKPSWNSGSFESKNAGKLESSVNIIGQEINLISTESGEPYANVGNTDIKDRHSENKGNEGISDVDLIKFISAAHPVPYGDRLVEFLYIFMEAFKHHTHRYHQMMPVVDITMTKLNKYNLNDILSKNVRLN
jgi:hypothetical protein